MGRAISSDGSEPEQRDTVSYKLGSNNVWALFNAWMILVHIYYYLYTHMHKHTVYSTVYIYMHGIFYIYYIIYVENKWSISANQLGILLFSGALDCWHKTCAFIRTPFPFPQSMSRWAPSDIQCVRLIYIPILFKCDVRILFPTRYIIIIRSGWRAAALRPISTIRHLIWRMLGCI